jgi:photosystem II stability/assembly factor-like uncharacterized protein
MCNPNSSKANLKLMSILHLAGNEQIRKKIKTISVTCLLLLILSIFPINPAFAHRPHDVVNTVEISPNYKQDKTVFILVRNNLFKSTDGGQKWQRIVKGLDYVGNLSDLSIAPKNKNILFLASTYDGIYKSEDSGNSWVKVNQGLETKQIETLVISPISSEVVLTTGIEKGLYKTTDGGKNWSKILDDKITAINFFPQQDNKILVGDQNGNIYLSSDQGKNWSKISNVQNGGAITVIAFSPDFSVDNTLLIGTQKAGIYQSKNEGKTWTEISKDITDPWIKDIEFSPQYNQDSTLFAITWSEAIFASHDQGKTWQQHSQGIIKDNQANDLKLPHFNDLVFAGDNLLIGGFNGLFQSTDAGNTWQEIETLSLGTITALAISPNYKNDNTLAIVTYVGMPYISQDQGETWTVTNKGLELPRFTLSFDNNHNNHNKYQDQEQDPRRFFDVAFSPNYSSDKTIFATTLWTKIIKTTNQGKGWNIISLPQEVRGMTIVPSPNFATDKTVFVGTQQDLIFKSTDGGQTFSFSGKVGSHFSNDPFSLVISPNFAEDKTVYASGNEGIYKSIDGGKKETWQAITQNTPLAKLGNIQLAISPNYKADQTLIVGTNEGLYITRDSGNSWDKFTNTPYDENAYIEGVAISPNYQNDQTFITSIRGHGLYKTVDDGKTFIHLGNDNIALGKMNSVPSAGMSVQFSPNYAQDDSLYGFGSASTQVYRSLDGGKTWDILDVPLYQESSNYDLLTSLDLAYYVYRSSILRVILAVVAAIVGYITLGYLGLEKILPLSRLMIKVMGTFTVFLAALFVCFKIL